MNFFDAIFQGIVQGLTEFLPISSSGHLSLVQHLSGQSGESGLMFSILLHFGTLIAVFLAFYKTIFQLIGEFFRMLKDIFTGKFSFKEMNAKRRMIVMLVVSLLPLCIFIFLSDFYKSVSSDNDIIVEGCGFLVTALLLFLADRQRPDPGKNAADMKYSDALAVGIAQGIAPMPGISRSGSTISVGLMMGLSREYAVAFSFIMGIPAVLGANILEIPDALAEQSMASPMVLIVGVVTAAVFGLLAIKMVKWLVKSNKFKIFAIYTLILGLATVAVGIYEHVSGNLLANFFVK